MSDVLMKYGKEKTLEILENLKQENKQEETEEELTQERIFSVDLMEELYRYELNSIDDFLKLYGKIKEFCRKNRVTGFDKNYKLYKESKKEKYIFSNNSIVVSE